MRRCEKAIKAPRNGKVRWTVPIKSDVGGMSRPLSTPVVNEDRVYTFSPSGDVHCLKTDNGEIVWSINLVNQYEMRLSMMGIISSPIVVDKMVIIHGNNVLVALNKMTGDEIWMHTDGTKPIEYKIGSSPDSGLRTKSGEKIKYRGELGTDLYSTPFPMSIDGKSYLIRQGVNGLEAYAIETGELIASVDGDAGGNVYDAGVVDGFRVLTKGLTTGAKNEMLRFNGNKFVSEWASDDFKAPILPFVFVDGYLYGFGADDFTRLPAFHIYDRFGRGFVCVSVSTGREMWRVNMPRRADTTARDDLLAFGGVTFVDDIFFILTTKGMLIAADLSSGGYNELSRGELPSGEYIPPAVVSGGRLYARSLGKLVCVDVSEE